MRTTTPGPFTPVSDPGGEGLSPERIRAARDASLRRLGVDTIDLYQAHGPDPAVPIEDTLAALDGLVPRLALAWLLGVPGVTAPPPEVSPHRMLREQLGFPDVPAVRRHP